MQTERQRYLPASWLDLVRGRRRRQELNAAGPRLPSRRGAPVQTPVAPNVVVQGLWVGGELSVMEQLSISSFLLHGHHYHLYVYDRPSNVPYGTVLMDAEEILPAASIFHYKDYPTVAGFANFFRYKLLLDRGGWWVDTDLVCLRPFDFPEDYVFSSQAGDADEDVITCAVIKAPAGSPVMAAAWETCQTKDPRRLEWGETGPALMQRLVPELGLERFLQSHHVFCPVDFPVWRKVLAPEAGPLVDERTYAVHLWNELWRRRGMDKNQRYPPACLYEQLKARYLSLTCYG